MALTYIFGIKKFSASHEGIENVKMDMTMHIIIGENASVEKGNVEQCLSDFNFIQRLEALRNLKLQ